MKTINSRFLVFLVLGGIFYLLQSCGGVYNSTNIPLDRALEIDQPLKIRTKDGTAYKITKLEKDETGMYGVVKKESNAARKHKEKIIVKDYQGKYVKLDIPEDSIQEIRTKNQTLSILLPITIGVAIIASFVAVVSTMAFMP